MEIEITTTITKCESKYYPMSKGKTCSRAESSLQSSYHDQETAYQFSMSKSTFFKKFLPRSTIV